MCPQFSSGCSNPVIVSACVKNTAVALCFLIACSTSSKLNTSPGGDCNSTTLSSENKTLINSSKDFSVYRLTVMAAYYSQTFAPKTRNANDHCVAGISEVIHHGFDSSVS